MESRSSYSDNERIVDAGRWKLRVPLAGRALGFLVMPTVHPAGDQRVIRTMQTAIDAGFAVHIVWLGETPGTTQWDDRIVETVIAAPKSTAERLLAVPKVFRFARKIQVASWHIHDFYMLPFAAYHRFRSKRPVVYDVHEHYPEYYSKKITRQRVAQNMLKVVIGALETSFAKYLGGVSLADEGMVSRFANKGVPLAVTANFPMIGPYRCLKRRFGANRRAIHVGTLDLGYGSQLIIDAARELHRIDSDVTIMAVKRFHSLSAREDFLSRLKSDGGCPANLELVEPVPAHHVAQLMSCAVIGLSTLQPSAQTQARASKLYEYVVAGLYPIVTDLPGQRGFVEELGYGKIVPVSDGLALARAIVDTADDGNALLAAEGGVQAAIINYSWERRGALELEALYSKLMWNA